MEEMGQKQQSQRDEEAKLLALKKQQGPQAKECGQPPAAGKFKDTESSPEPPEGTQPCCHLILAQ